MYIKGNVDKWGVGDVLVGECKCDPNKTIRLIYRGGYCWKFPYRVSTIVDSDIWKYDPNDRYDISDCSIPKIYKLSQYHNWRRVPKDGYIDCFKYGSLTVGDCTINTPIDYEIGDHIKIRGFEFEICQNHRHSYIYLARVEPFKEQPQKKINDRLREINSDIEKIKEKIKEVLCD